MLGFNGALIAGDIAAKSLLGRSWWAPLIGLAISSLIVVLSAAFSAQKLSLGPPPLDFYSAYGAEGDLQLLSDLNQAIGENNRTLVRKDRSLGYTYAALLGTLIYSVAILA